MFGLMIYFVIGSILAYVQITKADELHEKGIFDDKEYLIHKYKKPLIFSYITLFWLPAIIFQRKDD